VRLQATRDSAGNAFSRQLHCCTGLCLLFRSYPRGMNESHGPWQLRTTKTPTWAMGTIPVADIAVKFSVPLVVVVDMSSLGSGAKTSMGSKRRPKKQVYLGTMQLWKEHHVVCPIRCIIRQTSRRRLEDALEALITHSSRSKPRPYQGYQSPCLTSPSSPSPTSALNVQS